MKSKKSLSNNLICYSASIIFLLPTFSYASDEKSVATVARSTALNIDPTSGNYLLQMVAGLLIVLFCIIVLAWLAKKMNRFQSLPGDSLKIIASLGMGTRDRVVLLQVSDQQILLGVSAGNIQTLHVLDTPIDLTKQQTNDSSATEFSDKLKNMMTKMESSVKKTHK